MIGKPFSNKGKGRKLKLTPLRWCIPGLALTLLGIGLVLLLKPNLPPVQRLIRKLHSRAAGKPNFLLVTLDTTRADHLSVYGYPQNTTPNMDRLAGMGVTFEQAIASSPFTLPSHCSILTGLYPMFHGVRINGNTALSDKHLTMAEALTHAGYQCGAFIGAFVLDGRWGVSQGFAHYDDRFDLDKYKRLDLGAVQRPGNQVIDATLAWLDGRKTKPFFAWVHLYDPHVPYEPPEPYLSEYKMRGLSGLYDGEIAFMDHQIGRLVDWLATNRLDEKTVIILVGDHGEGLGEHGEMTHGYYIYDYALHVPLIMVMPGSRFHNLRISSQVRTIDVFPTVLEMANVPVPKEVQGKSLLPLFFADADTASRPALSESLAPNLQYGWSPLYSLRSYPWKYIDAPKMELYDLKADAEENRNLWLKESWRLKKMKGELKTLVKDASRNAPIAEAADLDTETMNRLATLGYIGTPATTKVFPGEGEKLADPKDKLKVFCAVTRANDMMSQDKYDDAVNILMPIVHNDPTVIQAQLLLANCFTHLHRIPEAKAFLNQILERDANQIQALIHLANILLDERKDEDVIAICLKALAVDPRNTQAMTVMGDLYMKKDDPARALPYLRQAAVIQPKMTQNRQNLVACLISQKQYAQAEPILQDIVRQHPKFPLAHFHLGLLYEELGKWADARKAYEKEIAFYPEEYSAHFNLGKLLFRFGNLPAYIREMEEVIRLAPNMPQGYLFLGRGLLHQGGEVDRIEALVKKGLSLAKSSELKALGCFLLADVYSRKRLPAKEAEALRMANQYKSKKE